MYLIIGISLVELPVSFNVLIMIWWSKRVSSFEISFENYEFVLMRS